MKTDELKCTDLIIGNLIDYFGDIIKVDVIEIFDGKERVGGETKDGRRVFDKPTYFEPIELTEEFAKKHIKDLKEEIIVGNITSCLLKNEKISVIFADGKMYRLVVYNYEDDNQFHIDIKYLHQLQNAYYCLTNEELEIEL